ncbi:MAG TPA: beta-phosphoglucomutase [Trueperaceae bacterium]|nr:beta-phosphoglucomutase [Trueperaceae bacterium]
MPRRGLERLRREGKRSLTVEPWRVREVGLDPERLAAHESVFALGNGYLGVRGVLEEGPPPGARSVPGTFLNGFHELDEIVYPEGGYGQAKVRQTLLNVTAATGLTVSLDGEPVGCGERARDHERTLDLRAGTLTRTLTWHGSGGKRTRLTYTRCVSLEHAGRMALRLEVEPIDGPVALEVTHRLDGRVQNQVERGDPRLGSALGGQVLLPVAHGHDDSGRLLLSQRADKSGMQLVCAADHEVSGSAPAVRAASEPYVATWSAALTAAGPATVDVRVVYLDARRAQPAELVAAAHAELDAYAAAGGVPALLAGQRAYLERFWGSADVVVEGDDAVQQSVRFGLFHLLQGAGRDGRTNIAAKALTGEGYEGHTFWDSEVYVVPVFTRVWPELARSLLAYRVALLPAAVARARELHRAGALYPWRTISGPEASAYFPAGTAQVHIDGDVVLAMRRYVEATGDVGLLWDGAVDVVFECARFYAGYGAVGRDGRFHLHTVTGPDEYTALVDDNHFTNKLVRETLRYAVELAAELPRLDAERWERAKARLGVTDAEVARWAELAELVHLPVDPSLGVTPQDASFLSKPEWPWDEVPPERYPLLLHYHYLDIYRHQVLKQADTLLAHTLLPEDVPRWQLRRDVAYYAPRTTHDSSLSACTHAVAYAELGDVETAARFFDATARVDLDDTHGNADHGVHVAAMGGTYLGLLDGFAGYRVQGGRMSFRPRLPRRWRRLAFRLNWRGSRVRVDVRRDVTRYELLSGRPVELLHRGRVVTLAHGDRVAVPTGPELRGVVFDLDGVITDTAELHYRAWQELADELGVPFDRRRNEALKGVDRMRSLQLVLEGSGLVLSEDELEELAERKNLRYVELLGGLGPGDVLPGVRELLDELEAAGVAVGLGSASRNAPTVLARLGLTGRFAAVVDPAAVFRGKPEPETFERAAHALGLLTDECVGIEDAAAGVAAVVGAGMAAVGVGDAATLRAAHLVVPGTAALTLDRLREAHATAFGVPLRDRR